MTKEEKAKLDNRRGSWRAKLQAQKDAHKGIIAKPESEDDEEEHPLDADGPAAALAATARMMATPTLVHSIEKRGCVPSPRGTGTSWFSWLAAGSSIHGASIAMVSLVLRILLIGRIRSA